MLSERKTRELKQSLEKKVDQIFSAGKKKGYDMWEITKINLAELQRLSNQIEILDIVLTYNLKA